MVKTHWPYTEEPKPGFIYFRRKRGRRVRIHYLDADGNQVFPTKDQPAEFNKAYQFTKAQYDGSPVGRGKPAAGTFEALIVEFLASPEYRTKAASTRKEYAWHAERLRAAWGHLLVADLKRSNIIRMRNKLADTPAQADARVRFISRLLTVAVDLDYREDHPGQKIEKINKPVPYLRWPATVLQEFEEKASDRAVDAYFLLRYSGQRIGDVAAMTRTDIVDGRIQEPRVQAHR